MKNGTFVIDLSALNKVRVKPGSLIAEVQGGARMQNITAACSAMGLVTACGTNPGTGIGGAALSGGYGWLTRSLGFVVDNIVGAEVVLPNGDLVSAAEEGEHADLLWALRGGGGNFGIAVGLQVRLHPAPPSIFAGKLVHFARSKAAKARLLRAFDDLMQSAPPEVTGAVVLAPSLFIHTIWCYAGNAKSLKEVPMLKAAERLAGLRVVRSTIRKRAQLDDIQRMLRPFQRSGHRFDSVVPIGKATEPLSDSFIAAIAEKFSLPPHTQIQSANVIMFSVGGNCALMDQGVKTCLAKDFRTSRYFAIIGAMWDEGSADRGREAAKEFCEDLKEICSTVKTVQTTYSANDLQDDHSREEDGFAVDEKEEHHDDMVTNAADIDGLNLPGYHTLYDKLKRAKEKYDPYNMLQQNVNIRARRKSDRARDSSRVKQWQDYLAARTTPMA